VLKRLIDVCLAIAGLGLLSPLLALSAIAILVTAGSPIFYCPVRIGMGGELFRMYKFRTMVPDAEQRLAEVAHMNVAEGMVKIPGDPRVTAVGRWLRRFSLDELPQMWNVLRGDMSFVGPRPHGINEIHAGDPIHRVRFMVRPGLTGVWQVQARMNPSLAVRVRCDLDYILNWSLSLDLKVLAETVPIVVFGRGDEVFVSPVQARPTMPMTVIGKQVAVIAKEPLEQHTWAR
jgi:lipopolysaccharide/colanic/teichoic acid biosynthesis glycosyltransferase